MGVTDLVLGQAALAVLADEGPAGQAMVHDAGAGSGARPTAQRIGPETHVVERIDYAAARWPAPRMTAGRPESDSGPATTYGDRHTASVAHRCIDSIYCGA
jgi:hypothetical protein